MDGLLRSEFALVLRDSLNSTPRRRPVPPPPPPSQQQPPLPPPPSALMRPCSPRKKPRQPLSVAAATPSFSLRCEMQLEPRANFAPFPTSPTSPLPPSSVTLPALVDPPRSHAVPLHQSPPLSPPPPPPPPPPPLASASRGVAPLSVAELTICKNRRSLAVCDKLRSCALISPTCSPPHSPVARAEAAAAATAVRLPSLSGRVWPTQRLDVLAAVSAQSAAELGSVSTLTTPSTTPCAKRGGSGGGGGCSSSTTSTTTTATATATATAAGRKKKGRAKSFSCSQCSSTFSQQFNLNKHVRAVHERRRPFECSVCHARFQQKSHRTMHHLAVHEKLRQFSCDQCNASFSWRGVLKKHRKSIHGLTE